MPMDIVYLFIFCIFSLLFKIIGLTLGANNGIAGCYLMRNTYYCLIKIYLLC